MLILPVLILLLAVHLAVVIIDMITVLLVVRALCQRWEYPKLQTMNAAGAPVTEAILGFVRRRVSRGASLRDDAVISIGLACLLSCRFLLALILGLVQIGRYEP